LLAHLIEGKVRLCLDYSPRDIIQDLELELGIRLTYMQSWRAREFVRMMVLDRAEDHYKLFPWMCATIVRANPKFVAFCEVPLSEDVCAICCKDKWVQIGVPHDAICIRLPS